MEPSLSKDRAMIDGDNPLFSNKFIEFNVFLTGKIHIGIFK
jgi:hypothetical protein